MVFNILAFIYIITYNANNQFSIPYHRQGFGENSKRPAKLVAFSIVDPMQIG